MAKQKKNYLDYIPQVNKMFNRIAQKVFKKPRYSFIKLDEFGSCVWREIDGKKTIYEIGQILKVQHQKAAEQLYERLAKFMGILEHNRYIVFVKGEK